MKPNAFGLESYHPRAKETNCCLGGELLRVAAVVAFIIVASMLGGA